MAKTDERRIEDPHRLARYQLQRPFHCGIDVIVTCESSKLITSGQNRHAAPLSNSPVADTGRHRFRKSDHVGAKPTGGSISNSLHSVTAAFFVVNEAVPGQNRLREPFQFVRKTKSRVSGPQNRITQCKSGVHVHLFIGYERASRSRLVWDQDTPGAAPGYSTIFNGL